MYNNEENEMTVEELALAMHEWIQHETMISSCEIVYEYGLRNFLLRLADYCSDPKECYALYALADFYKENERAFCQDAPTVQ